MRLIPETRVRSPVATHPLTSLNLSVSSLAPGLQLDSHYMGLQHSATRNFDFLFRFQDMAFNSSCLHNRALFCRKGIKKREGGRIRKFPSTSLETR